MSIRVIARDALARNTRIWSSGLRLPARKQNVATKPASRSYWWSTSHPAPTPVIANMAPTTPPSEASSPATSLPSADSTLPSPTAPSDALSPVPPLELSTASDYIPPLQLGDLAALDLISWTPAGLFRESLELVNVFTGLPWFSTLVLTTVMWQTALTPFGIIFLRYALTYEKLRWRIEEFEKMGTAVDDERTWDAVARKQKVLMSNNKIKLEHAWAFLPDATLIVAMLVGVKGMCTLPVAQLTQSGLDLLPDLTANNPVLPAVALLATGLYVAVQGKLVLLASSVVIEGRIRPWCYLSASQLAPLPIMLFMTDSAGLSSGVYVVGITSLLVSAVQARVLQINSVCQYLNIPVIERSTFREFLKGLNAATTKTNLEPKDKPKQTKKTQR